MVIFLSLEEQTLSHLYFKTVKRIKARRKCPSYFPFISVSFLQDQTAKIKVYLHNFAALELAFISKYII